MEKGALAVTVCVVLGAASCGGSSDSSSGDSTNAPSGEASNEVSRASMGDAWPLTVDSGFLNCEGSNGYGGVFFTSSDGIRYFVNGVAKQMGEHAEDIRDIWADDPNIPGAKKDIGPLIDRGTAMC